MLCSDSHIGVLKITSSLAASVYSLLHTSGFLYIMSEIRVKQHPTLGILVCTDGHVMTYSDKLNKPYWTIGYKTSRGYRAIKFKQKSYLVHRLIAETFIPNPGNLPEIDHYPDRTIILNVIEWPPGGGNIPMKIYRNTNTPIIHLLKKNTEYIKVNTMQKIGKNAEQSPRNII